MAKKTEVRKTQPEILAECLSLHKAIRQLGHTIRNRNLMERKMGPLPTPPSIYRAIELIDEELSDALSNGELDIKREVV